MAEGVPKGRPARQDKGVREGQSEGFSFERAGIRSRKEYYAAGTRQPAWGKR